MHSSLALCTKTSSSAPIASALMSTAWPPWASFPTRCFFSPLNVFWKAAARARLVASSRDASGAASSSTAGGGGARDAASGRKALARCSPPGARLWRRTKSAVALCTSAMVDVMRSTPADAIAIFDFRVSVARVARGDRARDSRDDSASGFSATPPSTAAATPPRAFVFRAFDFRGDARRIARVPLRSASSLGGASGCSAGSSGSSGRGAQVYSPDSSTR